VTVTEKITPLQAWHIATSIRLHFEGKFDAVKYHFKMPSLTQKAFEARKDRYFFEKLARNHAPLDEAIWYCTSNVMNGNKWIGDMNEEPYTDLCAWHESMNYRFEQEMKALQDSGETFDGLLLDLTQEGKPPRILQAYASNKISIHAIGVVQCLTKFIDYEMSKVKDPLGLWKEHSTQVQAYAKILERKLHQSILRNIVIQSFTLN